MAVPGDSSGHPAPLQGGIYAIRCLPTSRFYVGSAKCFRTRWRAHRSLLRSNRHPNPKLQKAWNRHGEGAFTFEVLEIIDDPSQLAERERVWVDRLRPDLNLYLTWYRSRPSGLAGRRMVRPVGRINLPERPGAA
jgi:group I intron endonuclease